MAEKLHGIIKPLLITGTLLDYLSFLLIQKKKKISELIKSAHFVLKLQQQIVKKHTPQL